MTAVRMFHPSRASCSSAIKEKISRGEEVLNYDIENLRIEQKNSMLMSQSNAKTEVDGDICSSEFMIPYLNREYLKDSSRDDESGNISIVRYVGMVQDMLEPEYYSLQVDGSHMKYRDYYFGQSMGRDHNEINVENLAERQPLIIVPVPFSSPWLNSLIHLNSGRKKCETNKFMAGEGNLTSRGKKRPIPNDECKQDRSRKNNSPSRDEEKMEERSNMSNMDWWPEGCMGSDPKQCPVLAKLYYEDKRSGKYDSLRLNDFVEIVSVLSFDPMDANFLADKYDCPNSGIHSQECFSSIIPPPSQMPRLHVLYYNHLDLDLISNRNTISKLPFSIPCDRSLCISILAKHIFQNNAVAAEALLLSLISTPERSVNSKPFLRNRLPTLKMPNQSSLGCASLNFILPDSAQCSLLQNRLKTTLHQLLPVISAVNVSSQNLNLAKVSPPSKGNDIDGDSRLHPSQLQLPRGATIILDGGSLMENLNDAGKKTLRSISAISERQVCPYQFGFCEYEYEADTSVIILSSENKSIIPSTLSMILDKVEMMDEVPDKLAHHDAERVQAYLARCRKPINVSVSRDVCQQAQDDFVERRVRRRNHKDLLTRQGEVKEEDLHRWLILARLQARSRCASSDEESQDLTIAAVVEDWNLGLLLDDAMVDGV